MISMRVRNLILIMMVGLFVACSGCCSPEKAAIRSPKQQEKCLSKQEEKDRKGLEKAEKQALKQHEKIQSKQTKKMMKQTKKQSNQYNTGKKGFFLFRWFRKD